MLFSIALLAEASLKVFLIVTTPVLATQGAKLAGTAVLSVGSFSA